MTDSGHTHEHDHDYPLISEIRGTLLKSYVGMMARLNGDIARELKRARGLSKGGPSLVLLQGGQEDAAANRLQLDLLKGRAFAFELNERLEEIGNHFAAAMGGSDLMKAGPPRKYKDQPGMVLDPVSHRWVSTAPEEQKEVHHAKAPDPAKRTITGAWYADDAGNVRFSPNASGRFRRKLSDEEGKNLVSSLVTVVSEMHGKVMTDFCVYSDIEEGVVNTLKQAAGVAMLTGQSTDEVFVQQYVAGELEEGEEEDQARIDELTEEATELFSNLTEAFTTAVKTDGWKKTVQELLLKQKKQALATAATIKREKKIIKDSFDDLMTDPADTSAIKSLAIMHDMGLFFRPANTEQARPYADSMEEAKKLVDTIILDVDRYNMLLKYSDSLSIEQQAALAEMALIIEADATNQADGEEAEKEFWETYINEEFHSGVDTLRGMQEAAGKTFTDDEFDKVAERVTELAKLVKHHLDVANDSRGGHVYKALHHRKTDLKTIFEDPDEVQRLKDLQATEDAMVEAALAAQVSKDHKIDPVVVKGLRNALKKMLDKKVANGEMTAAKAAKLVAEGDLFSFQKQAVAWMEAIESGVLAYDAGLGKTPISIAYISNMIKAGKIKRGVLVLPANLMAQWPKEIEQFRPGSKVQVISSDYSLEDRLAQINAINSGELEADFVIVSTGTVDTTQETEDRMQELAAQYESVLEKPLKRSEKTGKIIIPDAMRADMLETEGLLGQDKLVQALKGIDGAWIFDEAHSGGQGLKSATNMHHLIAKEVLSTKKYKFGMTATPMPEGPRDLFTLSNLFHPGSAGESANDFEGRMVTLESTYNENGKMVMMPAALDMESLKKAKKQIKPYVFMQRKSNKDILDEMESKGMKLPKVNPVSHALRLEGEARTIYNEASTQGFDDHHEPPGGYGKGYLKDNDMYAKMLRQHPKMADMVMNMRYYIRKQRAAISPKLLDKNYEGPQPKIDMAKDIIARHYADPKNKDKPVVIFSSWLDSLKLMEDELCEVRDASGKVTRPGIPRHLIGTISGEVDQGERDAVQDAVNAGKLKIVLIGIKAGGAGLNLQKSAYRNIFLDKPWTPADMEQAVGRTWRTGAEADTVYVHHMKVADSTDERKFEKLSGRVSLIDSLMFADMDQDYMQGQVYESQKRLLGSFDDDVDSWTPAQEAEALKLAGLKPGEIPPLHSIPSLRENFSLTEFREAIDLKAEKEFGDDKIKQMATMNDVKLKAKLISPAQHEAKKRSIAKAAKRWMELVGAGADHPIAVYTGDKFGYQSPGSSAVTGGGGIDKGKKPKAPPKANKFSEVLAAKMAMKIYTKHAKKMKVSEGSPLNGAGEAEMLTHFAKYSPADRKALASWLTSPKSKELGSPKHRKYLASLVAQSKTPRKSGGGSLPLPKGKTPLKMTEKSSFKLSDTGSNKFKAGTADWAVWEALRRKRPTSFKDAVSHMADWIYEYHADMPDPEDRYTKSQAKSAAAETITPQFLQKFVKQGLIEVQP